MRWRIAHLVLTLDPGGLERVVLSLARNGKALGQNVSVICLESPGILAPQVEAMGIPLHSVGKRPGLRLGVVGRLRRLFEETKPHVVHTHQIGALFYAGPAARRSRIPVVVHTEHGKHYDCRWQARWLGWWAGRYAQRFFCVSTDIATSVKAHRIAPAAKVEVVANGIEAARYADSSGAASLRHALSIPAAAPVIGTVGRLAEVKRQDVLLRAFARLESASHLVIVGDGPMRAELERLAIELGIGSRVHFTGYQEWPERYLHVMDVFALTSRSEGMPLAVLEAWAAGLPVVASRVGGVAELVSDGRNGLLFKRGDVGDLADRIQRLLCDFSAAKAIGSAGREEVRRRYDASVMAERYHRHYVGLIGRGETCMVAGSTSAADVSGRSSFRA